MINWVINSTLCSGMLLMVYQLLLKNTNLFNFNRAYLLLSILFSLTVPLIIVHQNERTTPEMPSFAAVQQQIVNVNSALTAETKTQATITPGKSQINYGYYAAVIYCIVAMLLLLRFFINLFFIIKEFRHQDKQRYGEAWLVLTDKDVVPHTFLGHIFLNKKYYYQNKIEQGVIDHEMAHAVQYHSIDVIFISLVQAVFWFNPFFFFFRRAIQLNHEFIADAAALRSSGNISRYQKLLLSKASLLPGLSITSEFNYSITKKRLMMMTKHTSAASAWAIRLTVIPVIAGAFILFCNKTIAQQPTSNNKPVDSAKSKDSNQPIASKSNNGGVMVHFDGRKYPSTINGISASEMAEYEAYETKYTTRRLDVSKSITKPEEERMEYLFQHMSLAQQKYRTIIFDYPPAPAHGSVVSAHDLATWADAGTYGIWLNGKRIKNAELQNINPKNINQIFFSRLTDKAVKNDGFHYQVELMTLAYYKSYRKQAIANRNNSMMLFHFKS
ncbi:M56 family metallopeptidase [Mucilaginibacter gotjawali]|uniref:Beta-lactamase regulating signal transducer with metallopeptidase domain n=2 Tax=Mucilaginibacter gotjawali TaxID=1550579 RepID=A0A839S7V6_9SPHI|nr:M56 family metallopeptidase [Mucilaginibacter gotjawali]MBB3053985.1 beta-lactamase regulating signal transducer with metallopeptidase domain [Mucilaginibacter gotjawali]BAU54250.1 BlaR1 peptidase M56 [Mucilaginibacter gotjawali]